MILIDTDVLIVTRNAQDFRASPIPAITPAEALETLF